MGVNKFLGLVLVVAAASAACTKTVNECSSDSDCKDVAYPFCDVNGEFGPSGGAKNVCTIVPPDCPTERCGCTAGATTCDGGQLTTCDPGGKTMTTTTCSLGCAESKDHCLAFDPSNGLGPAMASAGGAPAATIPDGSHIDTGACEVRNASNAKLSIGSIVIPGQTGICAIFAASFDIGNVTVSGDKLLGIVATGAVEIHGLIDASATHTIGGPGAQIAGGCVGMGALAADSGVTTGGGGGNATAGAIGESVSDATVDAKVNGGMAITSNGLVGGCSGGPSNNGGGAGGGGVQIDSMSSIHMEATPAGIDVGGGGAAGTSAAVFAGGGAGGTVILEAPTVDVGAVTANGGAGAACSMDGGDSTANMNASVAPTCHQTGTGPHYAATGGAGGTGAVAPTQGYATALNAAIILGGGGGGAAGKLIVRSLSGDYSAAATSVVSALVVKDTLTLH